MHRYESAEGSAASLDVDSANAQSEKTRAKVKYFVDAALRSADPRLQKATSAREVEEKRHLAAEQPSYMAEVEPAIQRFGRQCAELEDHRLPFPCIWTDGDRSSPLPVDLDAILMHWGLAGLTKLQGGSVDQALIDEIRRTLKSMGLDPTTVSVDDVRHFFRARVLDHLFVKVAEERKPEPPPRHDANNRTSGNGGVTGVAPNGVLGVSFNVITETPGLRVHVSTAAFFNPNTVFGGPSTPVEGFLSPGRYVFGGYFPNGEVRFDRGEFAVPYVREARLAL